MATRLYPGSTSVPITPAAASGWEDTASLIRQVATTSAAAFINQAPLTSGTGVANDDVACIQMIYGPVAGGSISGNVKGQWGAREASGSSDARAQCTIRVIAPDGSTVRGTLLAMDTAALSSEFVISSTTRDNRKFPRGGSTALSAVTATAGDYIVIELGYRNHNTNTSAVRLKNSDEAGVTTDLPEDETTTISDAGIYRGWIEFSNTIAPYTAASAGVATTVAFSANNAKTTIKPTANVASTVAFSANDATVSYVAPPRTVLVNSVDYTTKIRWDSFSFVESANRGQVGMSGFDIDDSTNTADIPALKLVSADEPRAGQSNKRMFTGFTHDRTTERGPNLVAGQRQWGVELLDLNALADDYILTSAESADRPAETDYARVVWLLTTRFNTVAGVASGIVPNSNTANMDAVDYRGRRARDVLNECSEMAGKNWFIYLYDTATPRLFYDVSSGTNLTSSAKISDVLADVDSSVTWAASAVKVHRSPDDIYSTVHLTYNGGTVSVTNATTASTYRTREFALLDLSVGTSAKATAKANAFLAASASEKIKVENVTVVLPAANVNDIRQGQRIQIKLDRHGISAFTYYRITERRVEPLNDVSYKVTLTLEDQILPTIYSSQRGGDVPYGIWEKKSNATDDGATVIVDRGGITVTDGAITVTNSGATVIIDGTSNMFKIAGTGTLSKTQATNSASTTVTTLTGLGTWAAMPAHLALQGFAGASAAQYTGGTVVDSTIAPGFVATSSGGAVTKRTISYPNLGQVAASLNGSSEFQFNHLVWNYDPDSGGASITSYVRYHVLLEAGI